MKSLDELISSFTAAGFEKVNNQFNKTIALSFLAGLYIGFGAIFYTIVMAAGQGSSFDKILGGLAFSLGLILVVIAKAELFTGSHLNVIPLLNKKITPLGLLKNWSLVYLGNFIGSLFLVTLVFLSSKYMEGNSSVGAKSLSIAEVKLNLSFVEAFSRAILCNILVCLAVWMAMAAGTVGGKIAAIIFPISAFVAMGFEHSVANMFFVPMALIIKAAAPKEFWLQVPEKSLDFLTTQAFLIDNLIPVTLGNIVGGAVFVGAIYWFINKKD